MVIILVIRILVHSGVPQGPPSLLDLPCQPVWNTYLLILLKRKVLFTSLRVF